MSVTGNQSDAMEFDPVEELKDSLRSLYDDPQFSDLTIASRETEFKVHKAIVCPRSDYFAAKFREPKSKASTDGFLSLQDDDPHAIEMVIRYFYHLDYPSEPAHNAPLLNGNANGNANGGHDDDINGSIRSDDQPPDKDVKAGEHSEPLDDFLPPQPSRLSKKKQKKRSKANAKQDVDVFEYPEPLSESLSSPITQEPSTVSQSLDNHSEGGGAVLDVKPASGYNVSVNGNGVTASNKSLVLHANVYALSRKYGVAGLRTLAFDKFKTEADNQWDTEEFLHAAEKVYSSCSDGEDDRKMKDVIVEMICRHGELMDKAETQKIMRTLPKDLMYDILLQVRQQGGFAK